VTGRGRAAVFLGCGAASGGWKCDFVVAAAMARTCVCGVGKRKQMDKKVVTCLSMVLGGFDLGRVGAKLVM
jgi:hypothetical protein